MDADNIIVLLVWGIFISVYIIASIRKKKQATNSAGTKAATKRHVNSPHTHPARFTNTIEPRTAPSAARSPMTTREPIIWQEEGQRVTVSKPMSPTRPTTSKPMQPVGHSRTRRDGTAHSMLHDKNALRRTLIFGQILEPKF